MTKLLKAALAIVGFIVAFDVAAVAVCLLFEILSMEFKTLVYTIWFVAGVFCGLLAYDKAGRMQANQTEGDWTGSPYAVKIGVTSLAITTALLAVLTLAFYKLLWHGALSGDNYVPDNMPLTLTYFGTILASMILGHTVLRPRSK